MDIRVVKYFDQSLPDQECRELLQEALEDEEIRREMIACRQLSSLLALDESRIDRVSGEEAYKRFIRHRRTSSGRVRSVRWIGSVAAAVLLFIGVRALFHPAVGLHPAAEAEWVQAEAPSPGGVRDLTLPDGTLVCLNSGSSLRYPGQFKGERRVELEGEAFFDVRPDAAHPFVVSTGKMDVKVLGTRFNVFSYPGRDLVISLLEGAVCAFRPESPEEVFRLNPGEQLEEREGRFLLHGLEEDPVTWMDGYFSFTDRTLGFILSRLECYYNVRIIVADPHLLEYRYTGKFSRSDDIISILAVLKKIYPFSVCPTDDPDVIRLESI
ncbi:MAG: FecR domain-containing protein [Bacteroidales bacterium]|nr:FecR domain-containing protein [Bacteroidales bacterium]